MHKIKQTLLALFPPQKEHFQTNDVLKSNRKGSKHAELLKTKKLS
jgi:hypothetical protein